LGTPALITENGVVMYGVVPVSRLLEQLEAQRGAAKPKTGSQGKTWF
jgi:hypothetical protein